MSIRRCSNYDRRKKQERQRKEKERCMVCLQCKSCVIHTCALQKWCILLEAIYKCHTFTFCFRQARAVTFPAEERHCPLAGIKLYCLVTGKIAIEIKTYCETMIMIMMMMMMTVLMMCVEGAVLPDPHQQHARGSQLIRQLPHLLRLSPLLSLGRHQLSFLFPRPACTHQCCQGAYGHLTVLPGNQQTPEVLLVNQQAPTSAAREPTRSNAVSHHDEVRLHEFHADEEVDENHHHHPQRHGQHLHDGWESSSDNTSWKTNSRSMITVADHTSTATRNLSNRTSSPGTAIQTPV